MPTLTEGHLAKVALTTRQVVLEHYSQDSCIASTLIGQKVLAHYGVKARPQATAAVAFNEAWVQAAKSGLPKDLWPDDAWSVGVTGTGIANHDTGRFDGHLVLLMRPQGHARLLLDLSVDQFSRPQRNLEVPGPVLAKVPSLWTPRDPTTALLRGEQGVRIEWTPLLGAGQWQDTKDGSDGAAHERYAAMVIERVDAR